MKQLLAAARMPRATMQRTVRHLVRAARMLCAVTQIMIYALRHYFLRFLGKPAFIALYAFGVMVDLLLGRDVPAR